MGNIVIVILQLGLTGLAGAFVLVMAFSEWSGKNSWLIAGLGAILSVVSIFILLDAKTMKRKKRFAGQTEKS